MRLDQHERRIIFAIRRAIREDKAGEFLHRTVLKNPDSPYSGYCYVASEAFIKLIRRKGYKPMHLSDEYAPALQLRQQGYFNDHWFVRAPDGRIIDPTADQFREIPDYHFAKGKGFLTKEPSKRGAALIRAARRYASPRS
jgi:hypothetical protein